MADEFNKAILKVTVGQICQSIGWHSIQATPLNILTDLLRRHLVEMGKAMRAYAEHGECKFHPRIRSPLIFSSPPIL